MQRLTICCLILALGLPGCAFYPKQAEGHVPSCDSHSLPMAIGVTDGQISCDGYHPEACVAAFVIIGAATFVVSATVVVLGNAVYLIDKSLNCESGEPLSEPGPVDEGQGW